MTKLKNIRQKLSEKLELPEDALGGSYRLQMIGNKVSLSGCKKLLKHQPEQIVVLTTDVEISFSGEQLKCIFFFEGNIELCGNISGIGIVHR